MKFDVVVGNPPYQEKDGGSKASAKPIYNLFTEFAIEKLNSDTVCLITPSKWFAGGKGLDSYRDYMLNNNHIKVLSDYVNSKDVFNGVSIGGGVSYFIYDRNFTGDCEVINYYDKVERTMTRPLNEFSVFVRYNDAVSLLHKVNKDSKDFVSGFVRPRNPFGFASNQRGKAESFSDSVLMLTSAGVTYVEEDKIISGQDIVDKYKVVISKVTSEHAGEPDKNGFFKVISSNRVMPPGTICTDSYLVVFSSDDEIEANNYLLYLKTKFYRTLLMLAVSSINLSTDKFQFIPMQNFSKKSNINWSLSIPEIDRQLYEKYGLEQNEINFIESKIKAMD